MSMIISKKDRADILAGIDGMKNAIYKGETGSIFFSKKNRRAWSVCIKTLERAMKGE